MTRSSKIHPPKCRWVDLRDMHSHRLKCQRAKKSAARLNRNSIVARKITKLICKSWYNKQINSDYNLLKYINSFINLSSRSSCEYNTWTATRLVELWFLITIGLISIILAIYLLERWIIFIDVLNFVDSVGAKYRFLHCRRTRVSNRTSLQRK
jgi:hypothetical protein